LNLEPMNVAASALLGEQDFSAFRAAGCQSATAIREVKHCVVERMGDYVVIDITANAFFASHGSQHCRLATGCWFWQVLSRVVRADIARA
jgi:hypothetical protein